MVTPVIEIPVLPSRSIVLDPPLSDEEFERLSMDCDFAFLERTKEGAILMNAPAGGMTSDGNSEINRQLRNWWFEHHRGRVYDSCCGFFLPDGSCLNPDAAYLTAEQIETLTRQARAKFLRISPAFVIELLSESDRPPAAAKKMEDWIANGVQLAWLVDPYSRQVHIYEPNAAPRIENGSHVAGSGPIEGFVLDPEEIWRCYE